MSREKSLTILYEFKRLESEAIIALIILSKEWTSSSLNGVDLIPSIFSTTSDTFFPSVTNINEISMSVSFSC